MAGELDRGRGPGSLADIASSGPSEGGGFVYDEATLRTLITKWLELADHYQSSLKVIDLGSTESPGLDFASKSQVDAANTSGRAYISYLRQNYEYSLRQAQLLQNTLHNYLEIEHQRVDEFNRGAHQ